MPCNPVASRLALVSFLILLVACEPSDRRPGLWLTGDAAAFPDNWAFTSAYPEIFVQVKTPYFLPHSVTIWCVALGEKLVIGARNPDDKNWPGWMAKSPAVTLKVGDKLYQGEAERVNDAAEIAEIKAAYAVKYQLSTDPNKPSPPMRYWYITNAQDSR